MPAGIQLMRHLNLPKSLPQIPVPNARRRREGNLYHYLTSWLLNAFKYSHPCNSRILTPGILTQTAYICWTPEKVNCLYMLPDLRKQKQQKCLSHLEILGLYTVYTKFPGGISGTLAGPEPGVQTFHCVDFPFP